LLLPLKDDIPTASFPVVTLGIILTNALVFCHQLALGVEESEQFILRWGAIPYAISHGAFLGGTAPFAQVVPLFSSMFVHGGFFHLFGNMLYLWIFGNNIEDRLGHFRFFLFYLVCGLAAAGAQISTQPDSMVPMVGASGAIAGILGAYLLTFPGGRVLTLVFVFIFVKLIRIPALIVLGFWFAVQLLSASLGAEEEVAFFAHIGGFISGLILVKFFQPGPLHSRTRWS
jgi:membrane associated rhomboid family serine protease